MKVVHPLTRAVDFQGREAELRALVSACAEGGVVWVQGAEGAGKTALLERFVSTVEPRGLAWSFEAQPDASALLDALGPLDPTSWFTVVLDGLERMQAPDPPHDLDDAALITLLTHLSRLGPAFTCICASRFPCPLPSEPLPGIAASDEEPVEVPTEPWRHPLVLTHVQRNPVPSLPPGPPALEALEQAMQHALDADAETLALTIYHERMTGAAWMVDCGEVERAERVVRRLLETVKERAGLFEDLGCILERRGRMREAAAQYWRAMPGSGKTGKVRLHLRLARNAALRGRLALAERLVRRALHRFTKTHLRELAGEAELLLAWIAHLRSGEGRIPRSWERDTQLALLYVDTRLRRGEPNLARVVAWGLSPRWGEDTTVGHEIRLARLRVELETQLRESTRPPSEIAAAMLDDDHLHEALDFFQRSGQHPALAQGRLLTARLRRLAGDPSGALNDLDDAADLARACGLELLAVDVLLESRHFYGEAPVREALERSLRPRVLYGWGGVVASLWLALDAQDDDTTRETRLAEALHALEDRVRRDRGLLLSPEDMLDLLHGERVRNPHAGTGALSREVTVARWGTTLRLPVEAPFAEAVNALMDTWDADVAKRLWSLYYESQRRDRDQPGPAYHLGVLCLMLGLERQATAIAEDLARCRPPAPGAESLLAACAAAPEAALPILRNAHDHGATLSYDLGLLCELGAHLEDARQAYARALRADWAHAPARARLRALDATETREKCRRTLKQTLHAATILHARDGRFPTDLHELVPALLGAVPACPDRGAAYLVRASASGDRLLLACRYHALRLDSRRGDLAPPRPIAPPDLRTADFLDHMRYLGPHIMAGGRLFVTTSRPARIVE